MYNYFFLPSSKTTVDLFWNVHLSLTKPGQKNYSVDGVNFKIILFQAVQFQSPLKNPYHTYFNHRSLMPEYGHPTDPSQFQTEFYPNDDQGDQLNKSVQENWHLKNENKSTYEKFIIPSSFNF